MTNLISTGQTTGALPPTEQAGNEFQLRMILDALDYHENGDDEDPACCTGDAPCETRIFLVGQQRKLAGVMIGEREEQIEAVKAKTKKIAQAGPQTSGTGRVANPASYKQIQFIKGLNEQHDTDKIGTFPRRTLDQILADQEVSKGRASSLIEVLLRQPKRTPDPIVPTPAAGPAPSDAQISFLQTLAEENGEDVPAVRTRQEASDEIGRLVQAREDRKTNGSVPQIRTPRVTEDGMYRTSDGTIYKVQIAKNGSGRLYAKKLTEDEGSWSFQFAAGAIVRLRPADKMTREQAQEFGRLYGVCCRCGADLTDEKSIAEGIGPICGDRF
jgi:hypothetical protein